MLFLLAALSLSLPASSKFFDLSSRPSGAPCASTPELQVRYDCFDPEAEKIGHLGSGAFGKVFACKDLKSGELVAVKEMVYRAGNKEKFDLDKHVARRELEISEFMASAPKRDPSVTYCRDGFLYSDRACLTMDLVLGKRAQEYIFNKKVSEAITRDFFKKFLKILAFVHSIGVSHNDVSLNNFMMEDGGAQRMKIIDFGLASFHKKGYLPALKEKRARMDAEKSSTWQKMMFSKSHDFFIDLQTLGVNLCTVITYAKFPCDNLKLFKEASPKKELLKLIKKMDKHFSNEVADVFEALLVGESIDYILALPWFSMTPREMAERRLMSWVQDLQ